MAACGVLLLGGCDHFFSFLDNDLIISIFSISRAGGRLQVLAQIGEEHKYSHTQFQAPRSADPGHRFWDPGARPALAHPTAGSRALSALVQWAAYGPTFAEPDFTDGLAAAVRAVHRHTTGSLQAVGNGGGGFAGLAPELEGMLAPNLFADLSRFAAESMGPLLDDEAFFHHEVRPRGRG